MRFAPISLGQTLRTLDAGGFIVTEAVHAPRMLLPPHVHENAGIAFVVSGSVRDVAGRAARQCGPDTLLIRPPREQHEDAYGERGARSLLIEIKPSRFSDLGAMFEKSDCVHGGMASVRLRRVFDELRRNDAYSPLSIEGLLLETIADLARVRTPVAGPRVPPWLAEAREYVRAHCGDSITLADVAARFEVHPMHLARSFRASFGASVGEIIRRARVERAAEAIATTSKRLSDIAADCGFADQSHLTREFRRHNGTTPAAYRVGIRRAGKR